MLNNLVSGDKFIELADFQYNRLNDYKNTYPIPNQASIIYCHTEFVNILFAESISYPYILISHNGDGKATNNPKNQYDADTRHLPINLIHWFANNLQIKHPRITSIPTGLENACWFPEINKQGKIWGSIRSAEINLCYMNFNLDTNPGERTYIYNRFRNKNWVTCEMGRNGVNFDRYLQCLLGHRFVLCPEGNSNGHYTAGGACGSHRFWEAIYCGCIPIVTNGPQLEHFAGLPYLAVESWDDVTYDLLRDYQIPTYDPSPLKMSHWQELIKNVNKEK